MEGGVSLADTQAKTGAGVRRLDARQAVARKCPVAVAVPAVAPRVPRVGLRRVEKGPVAAPAPSPLLGRPTSFSGVVGGLLV